MERPKDLEDNVAPALRRFLKSDAPLDRISREMLRCDLREFIDDADELRAYLVELEGRIDKAIAVSDPDFAARFIGIEIIRDKRREFRVDSEPQRSQRYFAGDSRSRHMARPTKGWIIGAAIIRLMRLHATV